MSRIARCASIFSTIALSALLALAPASVVHAAKPVVVDGIKLAFGPTDPAQFGLDDLAIDFFDSAKKSLDMAFYEIRLDSVVEAFIRAKKRGVKVRLIVDNDNYYARPEGTGDDDEGGEDVVAANDEAPKTRSGAAAAAEDKPLNPFIAKLKAAGINVVEDNGRSGLMHNKFAVRDGESVFTGSYNLTDTCSYKNPNNAMVIPSKEIAAVYATEFKAMYEDRLFGKDRQPQKHAPLFKVGKVGLEVLFAPEDNPNARIGEILAAAKKEIMFMQFAFTADELGAQLIAKHKAGVKVHGIFDRILYRSTGPFGEFAKLTDAGVQVRIYSGEGKFHNKVFIVDPDGDDPIVVLGSENASSNGNKSNDENVVILHSAAMAALYKAEFAKWEGKYSDVSAKINTLDFPFAGTILDEVDLVFFGNGSTIDQLTIEFPARWNLASQSAADVFVIRNGKNTTADEKLSVNGRRIVLDDARIRAAGAQSWLVFRFKNVHLPAIPGKYSLICSARNNGNNRAVVPLRQHPVVWVLDPHDEAAFTNQLLFMKRLNLAVRGIGAGFDVDHKSRLLKRVVGLNRRTLQLVCEAVKETNLERVRQALDFLDSLPPDGKKLVAQITDDYRPLRQAFQFREAHAPNAELKALHERFASIVGKQGN